MHRNGYLLVYIYSSIRGKEQLIPCCQTQYIFIYTSLVSRPEGEEEEKGFGLCSQLMRRGSIALPASLSAGDFIDKQRKTVG